MRESVNYRWWDYLIIQALRRKCASISSYCNRPNWNIILHKWIGLKRQNWLVLSRTAVLYQVISGVITAFLFLFKLSLAFFFMTKILFALHIFPPDFIKQSWTATKPVFQMSQYQLGWIQTTTMQYFFPHLILKCEQHIFVEIGRRRAISQSLVACDDA